MPALIGSGHTDVALKRGVTGIISAPWTIVPTEHPASLAGKLRAMDDLAAKLF